MNDSIPRIALLRGIESFVLQQAKLLTRAFRPYPMTKRQVSFQMVAIILCILI